MPDIGSGLSGFGQQVGDMLGGLLGTSQDALSDLPEPDEPSDLDGPDDLDHLDGDDPEDVVDEDADEEPEDDDDQTRHRDRRHRDRAPRPTTPRRNPYARLRLTSRRRPCR